MTTNIVSGYASECTTCPYSQQAHLIQEQKTNRQSPPIMLENNESNVLLVFQAPGDKEWDVGIAIQPTIKVGGSAGARIKYSWERTNKQRTDFNVINTVQCFPGNNGKRDLIPNSMAICSCSKRLTSILRAKEYQKIITFGRVAKEVIENLVKTLTYTPILVNAPHPNGGVKNIDLDILWN